MTEPAPDLMISRAEGPAFPPLIKVLATLLVAAMAYWGMATIFAAGPETLSTGSWLLVGGAFAIALVAYVWMLRSRTSIDAEAIEQTWLWRRRVMLAEISQAKFIYVPWLRWILAPRLIVRAGPGVRVFYCADPAVIAAFSALMAGMPPAPGRSGSARDHHAPLK